MKDYDFIAIGDMTTDAFVRLFPDSAEVVRDKHPKLCLGYGDKIPFEKAYVIAGVGNSANAAVAASRLGLRAALVTHTGNDYHGQEMLKKLKAEKIDTAFVTVNENMISNYHYVLWYKDDRTILIKHEPYVYHLPELPQKSWIYFSSVGESALAIHQELADFLAQNPDTRLAFQPGTFQIRLGAGKLASLYRRTHLFISNREEAQLILKTKNDDLEHLAKGIRALGPRLVVITDGVAGSYTYDENRLWFMPPYPDPKPPLERTGAGDAFSSTFASVLALGKSVEDAMTWAPINAMSVVQYVGAQEGLLDQEALTRLLKKAPRDYRPKLLKEF
ncbi:MAG: carbohydrate kinase family protein [Candidatus Ryanbacteria bacterium]|nr:carbohydrate kinase family protein [Candidatus Ryanbacteria bacterium]